VDNEEDVEASVVTPKRGALSRVAIHKNAAKRSSLLPNELPHRPVDDEDERPSYNAASLRALKDSTPSTPKDLTSAATSDVESVSSGTQALDISSKFGSSLARYGQPSAIPSATEIAEKKARRARLAKEQEADFISLDPDDPMLDDDEDLDPNVMRDERGNLVLKPKDKYGLSESRLVHEDEDIMENFDEFTEDGKIHLGRKAEAEAERKRRQDMAAQIAEAEGASDEDSDDSERERKEAYEASQTRHGTYGQNVTENDATNLRPRTPPIITPLPSLDGAIERLRKQLSEMQSARMQKLQDLEGLQQQKVALAEDEVRIQKALKETAEKFDLLRKEKGIGGSSQNDGTVAIKESTDMGINGHDAERDSLMQDQNILEAQKSVEVEDEDVEEEERPAFGGLGFGGTRQNLAGFGLGFLGDGEDSRAT
jgi:hypothetical protein